MKIKTLIEKLQEEAKNLSNGLNGEVKFATGPFSNADVLSIYTGEPTDNIIWIDIGEVD